MGPGSTCPAGGSSDGGRLAADGFDIGAADAEFVQCAVGKLRQFLDRGAVAPPGGSRLGCPVIDVTGLSIEETAHRVVRLVDRPYGKRLWRGLPPFARTRDLAQVLAFYRSRQAGCQQPAPAEAGTAA